MCGWFFLGGGSLKNDKTTELLLHTMLGRKKTRKAQSKKGHF